jgi:hypothetical protein
MQCIPDDTGQQLRQDVEMCEFFSLQLDECVMSVMFPKYSVLFRSPSAILILRRICRKQYRHMGRWR